MQEASAEQASRDMLDEELRFLKAESFVVTASKLPEQTAKSVATVTVVTEQQIKRMGARTLLDALKIVPGLGIAQSASGIRQLEVRGIQSTFSERVLIMLNGHPADHNLFWGGSMWTYDDLPIDNVKRIEVVRGPGSALYGANAFLATVNVITKDAQDIEGASLAAGGGTFDTQQYNAAVGKTHGEWHGMVNLNYSDTDGAHSPVAKDALGNAGHTNLYERRRDLEWNVGYGKKAVLDGRFISKTTGSFVGPSAFLSKDTEFNHDDYFLRLSSEWDIGDKLTVTGRVYRDFFRMDQLLEFRKNELSQLLANMNKTGGELQGTYRFGDKNILIAGFAYEFQEIRDVKQRKGPPDELLSIVPFARNAQRSIWGLYLQDRWDLTDTLRLIAGARYDKYSDFGETFNPRMGVNWEPYKGYSLRFSYGTAFRAPTFSELHSINNSTVLGNPDLRPEDVDTYEVGLNAAFSPDWTAELALFRNDVQNIIGRQVSTDSGGGVVINYANLSGVSVDGIEASTKYNFSENTYIAANYTFQHATREDTGRRVPDTPRHRATVMANIALLPRLHWYSEVQLKGSAVRNPGDARPNAPGYSISNTTLRALEIVPGLEVNFSVFNIFDSRDVYPFLALVPNDFPQPGRTFFAKLRYELK